MAGACRIAARRRSRGLRKGRHAWLTMGTLSLRPLEQRLYHRVRVAGPERLVRRRHERPVHCYDGGDAPE